MSDQPPLRPRVFPLDEGRTPKQTSAQSSYRIDEQPDAFDALEPAGLQNEEAAIETAQRAGVLKGALGSWSGVFWSAASALVLLAVGEWIDSLIESLFQRFAALGWLALALVALASAAIAVMGVREIIGVFQQRKIAALHAQLAAAHLADDRQTARAALRSLADLYAHRPQTAAARAHIVELTQEIVDARDLIEIAERTLIAPLDAQAQNEVARAAKRVSMLTTVSPRALLDVIFVAAQSIRLVRVIAEIYGGRPRFFGLLRIGRSILSHIAITGGMAVGDSLVQQILGHGVAARLSARLGEGVLNGLLTARVGLSAIAVCRPAPFIASEQPGVADVAPFLFAKGEGVDPK